MEGRVGEGASEGGGGAREGVEEMRFVFGPKEHLKEAIDRKTLHRHRSIKS